MAISDQPPAPPVPPSPVSDSRPGRRTSLALRPPDFIPKILPARQVHLFSGASGAGKSALTFSLLASMHKNIPFFSLPIRKPAFVGYLAADRAWDDHEMWLQTVGLESLPYYSLIDDLTITGKALRTPKLLGDRFDLFRRCVVGILVNEGIVPPLTSFSIPAVDEALKSLPWDSFLVVDPASLFLGGDTNRYDLTYTHMLDLNQFCLKHSCTIFAITHAGKQKVDSAQRYARAQDRILGTTAQTGCAGTTMHLAPPTETGEDWYEWTFVPHHAATSTVKLTKDSDGLFIEANTVLGSDRETKKKQSKEEKATVVLQLLPEDYSAIHITQLVSAAGELQISRAKVYRYLGILEESGLVTTAGNRPGHWQRKKSN